MKFGHPEIRKSVLFRYFFLSFLLLPFTLSFAADSELATPLAPPNFFAEAFFMKPDQRIQYQTTEVRGFVLVETPDRESGSRYSMVTDFGGSAVKMRALLGIPDLEEIRKWIDDNLETADFEGVEIRRLPFVDAQGSDKSLYWVGHKSFETAEKAQAQIALVKSVAELEGGDFAAMVQEAKSFMHGPEPEPVEIKTPAQFQKEEEIVLKFLDQLDIGNELFGPFQGVAMGEPILWQSFGETTWRQTNLDKRNFSDQVGFWTNRLVFKGIRFPLNTIDLFLEATGALESHGKDFASHLDLSAGLEWRPLGRNPVLYNFRPWGLPLLEWVRNHRIYVQYMDRKNLKDEILGSKDYDIRAGFQLFYDFGIDLPSAAEGPPSGFADFLREYVWGEIFYDHRWEQTDFTSEDDFNAFIFNSSIILGFRLPGIPLPSNYINDELVLMPYLRFEHTNNSEFSFHYQNQYFVAAGCRWMPFRTYRFKENEWLFRTKIFTEWVGIGDVQNAKQNDEARIPVHHDLRFGLSFSERRF